MKKKWLIAFQCVCQPNLSYLACDGKAILSRDGGERLRANVPRSGGQACRQARSAEGAALRPLPGRP
ncbi:hypothetical protein, partial [Tatumella sp. JGM118]|uniref:hypothetical protein n=1 Tax=Tatumella sp. JGM118 TaxID=2799796 RepID=UPI001BB07294